MFFSRPFSRSTISRFALVGGACLCALFVAHPTAFAIGSTTADNPAAALAQILSLVVNLITFFILLMINYMGDLFGVEMMVGDAPMSVIRPMWVVIRNITNIVFIGLLVGLVFTNLFGVANWSVKKKLPKVIIALVAINFSLLAFRVVLDAVNVGTMAVLSIPHDIMQKRNIGSVQDIMTQGYNKENEQCDVLSTPQGLSFQNNQALTVGSNTYTKHHSGQEDCAPFFARMNSYLCDGVYSAEEAKTNDSCIFYIDPLKLTSTGGASSVAGHNLMSAFGVYIFRVEQLPALAGKIQSWDGVVMNVLFSTIMALAFFVALFAVFLVMLVRMVVMWIFMVFSPLLIAGTIMGIGGNNMISMFVKYLIIPIKVAAVFAVTYIMMSAMVSFSVDAMNKDYLQLGPSLSIFGMGISGLLWQVATVGIFWKTAFMAMKGTIADGIVKSIQNGATSMAKMLGSAATIDRPIFPGKDGKNFSLGSVARTPQLLQAAYNSKRNASNDNFREAIGIQNSEAVKKLESLKAEYLNDGNVLSKVNSSLKSIGAKGLMENREKTKETILESFQNANVDIRNEQSWDRFKTELDSGNLSDASIERFINRINARASQLNITPLNNQNNPRTPYSGSGLPAPSGTWDQAMIDSLADWLRNNNKQITTAQASSLATAYGASDVATFKNDLNNKEAGSVQ